RAREGWTRRFAPLSPPATYFMMLPSQHTPPPRVPLLRPERAAVKDCAFVPGAACPAETSRCSDGRPARRGSRPRRAKIVQPPPSAPVALRLLRLRAPTAQFLYVDFPSCQSPFLIPFRSVDCRIARCRKAIGREGLRRPKSPPSGVLEPPR
ncbi:hypothetical protein THAOC_29366, partial [Thalassiosira oceanica]